MNNNRFQNGPKTDWEHQARDISNGTVKVSADDIPELLAWLQDMNWPGALEISNFLQKQVDLCLEPIKQILNGDDNIWKYHILFSIVSEWDIDNQRKLSEELISLAKGNDPEEVHLLAHELCIKCQIVKTAVSNELEDTNKDLTDK